LRSTTFLNPIQHLFSSENCELFWNTVEMFIRFLAYVQSIGYKDDGGWINSRNFEILSVRNLNLEEKNS
jgi:hypothetical protein